MASLVEMEKDEQLLEAFSHRLTEEIERLKGVRIPKVRAELIQKIQIQMFDTALKLSFDAKSH